MNDVAVRLERGIIIFEEGESVEVQELTPLEVE